MKESSGLHRAMRDQLESRRRRGSLRSLKKISKNEAVHDFSSNDYLDLSGSSTLRTLFEDNMAAQSSLASTGSRLLSGNSMLVEQIESDASRYWQSQDALLCASGYEANVSIFGCIPQSGDTIIYDELIHASVHVGMKHSRASQKVMFRHNDMAHLEHLLRKAAHKGPSNTVFLAVETVYSMDGDLAPLNEIVRLVRKECPWALLILDEAHATGIFGNSGQGLAFSAGVYDAPEVFLRLHTFGKGAAGTGAVILCNSLVKQYLLNYAKGLIYSTYMSTPALCLTKASLTMLSTSQTEHAHDSLWSRIKYTQKALEALPHSNMLEIPALIESPIIPILSSSAVELSAYLQRRGYRVMPVRYPTVAKGRERIRICLRADIGYSIIDGLVAAIGDWIASEDILTHKSKAGMLSTQLLAKL